MKRLVRRVLPVALPLVLAACGCTTLRAQDHVEVYATGNVTHLSAVPTGFAAVGNVYQLQFSSLTRVGFGGGVTVPVFRLPRVTVGVDLRGGASHGIADYDNSLFGIQLRLKLPHARMKPWMEGGGGFLAARQANISPAASGQATTSGQYPSHFAIVEGLAGIDYPFRKQFDIRVVEVGLGSSFGTGRDTVLFQAGAGVLLHF